MILNYMYILQELPQKVIESQFEKITNPILAILLLGLGIIIYLLFRQLGTKDKFIHTLYLEQAANNLKNIEVLTMIKNSMDIDSSAVRALETLIKDTNMRMNDISIGIKTVEGLLNYKTK